MIWDTAGQERYHALNQVYYRGAEGIASQMICIFLIIGAIVVYDCTDMDTFKKMNQWVSELKQYLPSEIPIMIAGNKADLSGRMIEDEAAASYARSVGSLYFPTSAKSGSNVNEVFQALA